MLSQIENSGPQECEKTSAAVSIPYIFVGLKDFDQWKKKGNFVAFFSEK